MVVTAFTFLTFLTLGLASFLFQIVLKASVDRQSTDTVGRVSVDISADISTEYQPTRGRDSADMSVDTSADIRLTFLCLCRLVDRHFHRYFDRIID